MEVPTDPVYVAMVLASKVYSRRELRRILSGLGSTASGSVQIVENPVPQGRRGGGGLQSLRPGQNSTALGGAEPVDIPVPSGRGAEGGLQGFRLGQGSSASSSMDRSYVGDGAFDRGFRTFPGVKKSAEVAGQVSARVRPHSRSWTPAAYGHGTLLGEDDGQGDFFQDGDEEEEEEELEIFDESIDRFELSGWRPRRLCCNYMAGCCARGWGCTFAHGEQELHPSSLPGALRGRASAADHG